MHGDEAILVGALADLHVGGTTLPAWVTNASTDRVSSVLERHRIHGLWFAALSERGLATALPPSLHQRLEELRGRDIARSLVLERAVARAAAALDERGIPWVAFKGFPLARAIYAAAHLRPMLDADMVVRPADLEPARAALHRAAFVEAAQRSGALGQVNLLWEDGCVDLHGGVLGGRARVDLAEALVSSRRQRDDLWVPSPTLTTALLLLHPALTDYVTAKAVRAVDLARWLRRPDADVDGAVGLCHDAGLATAAWAMAHWTARCFPDAISDALLRSLEPSVARRAYLRAWVKRDPAKVYRRAPTLARAAFSLALHDSPRDVARVLIRRRGREL